MLPGKNSPWKECLLHILGSGRNVVHWLPIEHHSLFNNDLWVYNYLESGCPKYFEPFSFSNHSLYTTCQNEDDCVVLEISHFFKLWLTP